MDRISVLPDELLVKILSFVPTKDAVSTSILSKRWEFLWMWVPKLEFEEYYESAPEVRDFINKNLPLHRAPVIESFYFEYFPSSLQPGDINRWVAITVSRFIRELHIDCSISYTGPAVLLPSSLYTCESLVTLKLLGSAILVDVPRTVSLPSLKNLLLWSVTYLNKDSLRLLLSYCPVLEELKIKRHRDDNAKGIVVISPSLLRLTLPKFCGHSCSDEFVIVTPSLKYLKVHEFKGKYSYLITHMPNLEEADIVVDLHLEKLFESISSVRRLSLCDTFDYKYLCHDGILFSQLEHLKLHIRFDYWSNLLLRLLQDSPNLRVLSLSVNTNFNFENCQPITWINDQRSVPTCLLESLETFEFAEYSGTQEERDFVSFIFKNARHLKSSTITPPTRKDNAVFQWITAGLMQFISPDPLTDSSDDD